MCPGGREPVESVETGSGSRILRSALRDAAEIRRTAHREAQALLARAHAAAEVERRALERNLYERTADVVEGAQRRDIELDQREREIVAQAADARKESARLMILVVQEAEEMFAAARREVDDLRAEWRRTPRRHRVDVEAEVDRLGVVRHGVVEELGRLVGQFRPARSGRRDAASARRPPTDAGRAGVPPRRSSKGGPIDLDRPSAARIDDYLLGGGHHFARDRALADRLTAAYPGFPDLLRASRVFVRRSVQFCVGHGVRQFLELGSGIVPGPQLHELARTMAPESRVAYVDVDPVVVAHSRDRLAGVDGVSITSADVRHPETVLDAPGVLDVLDFSEPVAVLAVGLLPFLSEADRPRAILAEYRRAMAPGSHLVISHLSADQQDPALAARIAEMIALYGDSATPAHRRSRAAIAELLDGLPLVDPGLVDVNEWADHTGSPRAALGAYAAVARIL